MKTQFVSMVCALAALTVSAVTLPEISDVVMSQNGGGKLVTVSYCLRGAPAVVTFDVQTNTPNGWVSVGADVLSSAIGDVWKVVPEGSDAKVIRWPARDAWPDHAVPNGSARAVVTAWPLDDTPDYLVVDLVQDSDLRVAYYPSEAHLPGGLLTNEAYRKSKVVLRRIHARGITWARGASYEYQRSNNEQHLVTLDNDYYIGVFPMTQGQCGLLYSSPSTKPGFAVDGEMRPLENIASYFWVRDLKVGASQNASDAEPHYYPNPPCSDSFLGLMRTRSGNLVDFDLPSEAQWEYACRAGTVEDQWNTGAQMLTTISNPQTTFDITMPGRNCENQATSGNTQTLTDQGPSNCTCVVGTYAPNGWGIYDMHGNVREWCVDWFANVYDVSLNGLPNCNGVYYAGGTTKPNPVSRVLRGGSWKFAANTCSSSGRSYATQDTRGMDIGFRVVCRMGLR